MSTSSKSVAILGGGISGLTCALRLAHAGHRVTIFEGSDQLGGLGTFFGPLVGAALVVCMQSFLSATIIPTPVIIGVTFVACVLSFRKGVFGQIKHWLKQRKRQAGPPH